jgi:hypothetical protein
MMRVLSIFRIALIILFLHTLGQVHAQKILISPHISDSLSVIVPAKFATFKIDPIQGDSLFLVYYAKDSILPPKIYIFIDKKDSKGVYQEFDNQKINIDSIQKTIFVKYLFNKEGVYQISIADAHKKKIISMYLTISFVTNLVFCQEIDKISDKPLEYTPLGSKRQFKLDVNNECNIYAYLQLSKPIACKKIFLEIYALGSKQYDKLIIHRSFAIKPDWEYTYLKSNFRKIGKYRVIIKNDKGRILGINYLEIID